MPNGRNLKLGLFETPPGGGTRLLAFSRDPELIQLVRERLLAEKRQAGPRALPRDRTLKSGPGDQAD